MLLVVVDEAGVRRRGDDPVEAALERDLASRRRGRPRPSRAGHAHSLERLQPLERVEEVAARGTCPPPARASTCAGACGTSTARAGAPAGSRGRSASSAGRSARRARARREGRRRARSRRRSSGSGEARRPRRGANHSRDVPAAARRRDRPTPRERVAKVGLELEQVVVGRLHAHEQAVERGDVDADRVVARLEAWTSVVPEPANGSSTRPPGLT